MRLQRFAFMFAGIFCLAACSTMSNKENRNPSSAANAAEDKKTQSREKLEEYGRLLLRDASSVEVLGVAENGEACELAISVYKNQMYMDYVFRDEGETYADSMFNPNYAIFTDGESVKEAAPVSLSSNKTKYSLTVASSIDQSRATLNLFILSGRMVSADFFAGGVLEYQRGQSLRTCKLALRIVDNKKGARKLILQNPVFN